MGSLGAYIEGMDGLSFHFTATNSSDLAAWVRFGTSTLFERHLLLQYDLVLPNSSTHVATLYLGPMGSLGAYIEGMDGLSLHFTAANSSDLAACRPGLALRSSSKDICSSSMIWCSPILLRMLQHCIWDPWGALGRILKEWMAFPSTSQLPTALIWRPVPGCLALRPSSQDVCSSRMIGCSPILLRMLQHCIWDPWGALGRILKEWMAFPSTSQQPTAPIWLPVPGCLALRPSSKDVCSSSMIGCSPIL